MPKIVLLNLVRCVLYASELRCTGCANFFFFFVGCLPLFACPLQAPLSDTAGAGPSCGCDTAVCVSPPPGPGMAVLAAPHLAGCARL